MLAGYLCNHCREGLVKDEGKGWGSCPVCAYDLDVQTLQRIFVGDGEA